MAVLSVRMRALKLIHTPRTALMAIQAGAKPATRGLLTMTDAHWSRTIDFLRSAGLTKPGIDYTSAYTLGVVDDVKVLP